MVCVFFFKQKTAYEMRISDWSSDVCSSDQAWPDESVEALSSGFRRSSPRFPSSSVAVPESLRPDALISTHHRTCHRRSLAPFPCSAFRQLLQSNRQGDRKSTRLNSSH